MFSVITLHFLSYTYSIWMLQTDLHMQCHVTVESWGKKKSHYIPELVKTTHICSVLRPLSLNIYCNAEVL